MPPLLCIEDLDQALSQGCRDPHCTHQDHRTLYLNSACHPRRTKVRIVPVPGGVQLDCARCGKQITALRCDPAPPMPLASPCRCGGGSGIQARYTQGSDRAEVTCWGCDKVLFTLRLVSRKGPAPESARCPCNQWAWGPAHLKQGPHQAPDGSWHAPHCTMVPRPGTSPPN